MTKVQQTKSSLICAVIHVSESEVILLDSTYTSDIEQSDPGKLEYLLFSLGLDVQQPYQRFDAIQHRNRLNQVVVCSRWCGNERNDKQWLTSGHASKAAKDRASNNFIVEDSYRQRHETVDAQYTLEQRDRYYEEEKTKEELKSTKRKSKRKEKSNE
jgi:hypothetical protein